MPRASQYFSWGHFIVRQRLESPEIARPGPPAPRALPVLPAPPAPPRRRPQYGALLRRRPHGRVRDSELFEVGLVPGRVVVVLLHLRPVLRHDLLVEPDGRLVLGPDQRDVLRGL